VSFDIFCYYRQLDINKEQLHELELCVHSNGEQLHVPDRQRRSPPTGLQPRDGVWTTRGNIARFTFYVNKYSS